MTRIAILRREDMNAEQGAVFDAAQAAGGPTAGPHWAYIRSPRLMQICQDLGNYFRGSRLSGRERQIAVLTVVRHWDAEFPWAVQVRASLAAGVDQDTIDAINANTPPPLEDAREKAAHQVASELLSDHRLSDATYTDAARLFDEEELVTLVGAIGYFGMVCSTANAFDITPPDDAPARLIG